MASYPQSSGPQPFTPTMGSSGIPQNFGTPIPVQFRPVVPAHQTHQLVPAPSQQFPPVHMIPTTRTLMRVNSMQAPEFSQVTHPSISVQHGHGHSSTDIVSAAYIQTVRPASSGPLPLQNAQVLNNHLPSFVATAMPLSASFTFTSSFRQPSSNTSGPSEPGLVSGMRIVPALAPTAQDAVQSSVLAAATPVMCAHHSERQRFTDWQVHKSPDGKSYYYNAKTKQSTWEKPLELMTPIERVDASTGWKECTSPDGRKYYYNHITKQSKWIIPDELKLAREQAEKTIDQAEKTMDQSVPSDVDSAVVSPLAANSVSVGMSSSSSFDRPSAASDSSLSLVTAISSSGELPKPDFVDPVKVAAPTSPTIAGPTCDLDSSNPLLGTNTVNSLTVHAPVIPSSAAIDTHSADIVTSTETRPNDEPEHLSLPNSEILVHGDSAQELEQVTRDILANGETNVHHVDKKSSLDEPHVYSNKLEARSAFLALLESSNIQSDWSWDQVMRVIINDKRYTALKTLAERKQAFNEYLSKRIKLEAEERRIKLKKAQEEFIKMLEECKDLKSSMKWSKAMAMFEGDERFKAIGRSREREDLFENYIIEFQKKEKVKAAEEHKRNILEYRAFLESCDFITANSQWRKVQDRLEEDERCSRLEKIDRLKIFQDYVHDLEKEEEEKRKMQKEQKRREERKNRDEFRKLMEEHVSAGILTVKTNWREYCMKVKDLSPFTAVSSNTSGATPKEMFEDVLEDLDKQCQEDKSRIKDSFKSRKIILSSSSTYEDFTTAISEDDRLTQITETNLRLVFLELLNRAREKEERDAKKRRHLADNFLSLLKSIKEISASSSWEGCRYLFEDSKEYKSLPEERLAKETFEGYIANIKFHDAGERKRDEEKAKTDTDRYGKEKREEKAKREKDRVKGHAKKNEIEDASIDKKEERKKDGDKDRNRKRSRDRADLNYDVDGKDKSEKSHVHVDDRRKLDKHHWCGPESSSEKRQKKHKKDRYESAHAAYEDLEDGELGQEIC